MRPMRELPDKKRKNPEEAGKTAPPDALPAPAVECEVIDPPKRGRPSKRTPELEAAIAECLRLGMSYPQLCDACGISQTQFRQWRKHYRDFQQLVRRAEAEAVKLNLAVIQAAAASGKSWQAAAWFLERKHPEQWGKTETLTVEARKAAVTEALRNVTPGRTPAQLREMRAVLGLPRDADAETIEAAIEHAKDEGLRKATAEIMGVPYNPKPFEGGPDKGRHGLSPEALARIDRIILDPTREERIRAIIELQAKAREVAGKPPLSEAEAFEAAAREIDNNGSTTGEAED